MPPSENPYSLQDWRNIYKTAKDLLEGDELALAQAINGEAEHNEYSLVLDGITEKIQMIEALIRGKTKTTLALVS